MRITYRMVMDGHAYMESSYNCLFVFLLFARVWEKFLGLKDHDARAIPSMAGVRASAIWWTQCWREKEQWKAGPQHISWFPSLSLRSNVFQFHPENTHLSSLITGVCQELRNIEADALGQSYSY